MNRAKSLKKLNLLRSKKRILARQNHLNFIDYTWQEGKTKPFIVGFHTRKICEEIDLAMEKYRNGESSFLLISVPPRHGKSDIASRYLSPHFIGEFPGTECMQISYGTDLATTFSEKARRLVTTPEFKDLYPKTFLSTDSSAKSDWKLIDSTDNISSSVRALGFTAGLTGKGYSLGIVDDYNKSWHEILNPDNREKAWNAFTTDFLTRREPVSITVIIATQWHYDDIIGRIKIAQKVDKDFPQFKVLSFPAKAKHYKGPGKYPGEYLFEERFGKKYYRQAYATMGSKQSRALMDCNPQMEAGEVLITENIAYIDPKDCPGKTQLKWHRIWDLAHTEKQRNKDDPDYTSGTLLAFEYRDGDPVPYLYIKNVSRFRHGAVKRNEKMKRVARKDGPFVVQAIEDSIDSKDAYAILRNEIPEISWQKVDMMGKGDKLVRVIPLESIFEAPGHVIVVRGHWNDDWKEEIERFTGSGKEHDDQVDNLSSGYILCCDGGKGLDEETQELMRLMNGG